MIYSQLGDFDQDFRTCMEHIIGRTSDFTWAFMGLGCKKGGLGLRSAQLHSLGGYLSSFSSASFWITARFASISQADVSSYQLSFMWSSTFGELPEKLFQRALSAA